MLRTSVYICVDAAGRHTQPEYPDSTPLERLDPTLPESPDPTPPECPDLTPLERLDRNPLFTKPTIVFPR